MTRFWHGGTPGLKPGDVLRPGAIVGARNLAQALRVDHDDYDPNVLYVTSDKAHARFFAASWRSADTALDYVRGDLYNVRPKGGRAPDPDYPDGVCWSCARAVIIAVVERNVPETLQVSLAGSRYTTWEDSRPMYDAAGWMQPSPEMEAFGITAEDLRPLGVLPQPGDTVDAFCQAVVASRTA